MKTLTLSILLLCLSGCSALQAWKGELGYNTKTGQASGQLKGASGNYSENTGLNLTTGDNTWAALAVAGGVGLLIFAAYPIQRALRLRKEEQWAKRQRNGYPGSSGSPSVQPEVSVSPTLPPPSKTGSAT